MSAVHSSHASHGGTPQPNARDAMRTSRFDIVRSMLMALMLFIGVFVLLLFLVWLTRQLTFRAVEFPPVVEQAAGRGDNAEGFERDFEPPGAEEIEELLEPTLQDTLMAVTDVASTVAASLDSANTDATASTKGAASGDSRRAGPEGEGADIIPRSERWNLKFTAKNVSGYADQLDFYNIELAAIGGGIQGVDIASQLSGTPAVRRGDSESEKGRLYFMWTTPSPLMQFDRQLLQKANIPLGGRQTLKFIPKQLENELAAIEMEYAKQQGHTSVAEIARTVFESRPQGAGYRFEVIEQRYRVPSSS